MGPLIDFIRDNRPVQLLATLLALTGIGWSLFVYVRVWREHSERTRAASQRRRSRRIRPTPQVSTNPTAASTAAARQQDLLADLGTEPEGPPAPAGPAAPVAPPEPERPTSLDTGPGTTDTAERESKSDTDAGLAPSEQPTQRRESHATYAVDGTAITRRNLKPYGSSEKEKSTQIMRPFAGADADGANAETSSRAMADELRAAIRDAVEDSLREEGAETDFATPGQDDGAGVATDEAQPGDSLEADASDTRGAEPLTEQLSAPTVVGPDAEDAAQDHEADDAVDADIAAQRRRRQVSTEIIHRNARRHEELGLHFGITQDGERTDPTDAQQAEPAVSEADKQARLRELGLTGDANEPSSDEADVSTTHMRSILEKLDHTLGTDSGLGDNDATTSADAAAAAAAAGNAIDRLGSDIGDLPTREHRSTTGDPALDDGIDTSPEAEAAERRASQAASFDSAEAAADISKGPTRPIAPQRPDAQHEPAVSAPDEASAIDNEAEAEAQAEAEATAPADSDAPPSDATSEAPANTGIPDWARSDTFDEDLEGGGDEPKQQSLFD
ncbi:MAG: hypothetical protein ACOCYN_00170 [Planctomycetota bacterium]